jgi:hypothetical protein
MIALDEHLGGCETCRRNYRSLAQTQRLLSMAGRRKAPADLALKLRVGISQEVARSKNYNRGTMVRLENLLRSFMVPATAGLATAVTMFAFLIGSLAFPAQANHDDVPLLLHTAPVLQQAAFGTNLDSISDDSLVIEAYVDSNGRVQDYRILSDSKESAVLLPKVKNMLIFTTFRPATTMGRPTSGRAVLSFSKISVKG